MPTDVDPGLDDALDPEITLDPVTLRAEPGGQVQLTVKLRNPGRYVESYSLHLNGLPQSWWQASPPEVAVYAHSDATATIAISPPVGVEIPPGPIPFAVIAVSTRDDRLRAAEEADLEVGRVFAVQASITPVTSSARWSGRHRLTINNWGNGPAVLRLYGHDKDAKLGFLIRPEVVSVPVGGSVTARVRARPRAPFLRGAQVHLPFQIMGDPSATGGPPTLPGIRPDLPGASGAARLAGSLAGTPGLRTPGMPAIPGAMPGMPGGGVVAGPAGVLPAPVGGFSVDGAVLQRPVWPKTAGMVAMIATLAIVALVVLMVKFSNVVGAKLPDQAPGKVTGVKVEGTGPKSVNVRWAAVARAQQYSIQPLEDVTHNAIGDPVVVKAPATIQNVDVKEASTRVCFQVTAIRLPDNVGESSDPVCGSSLSGTLDDPQDVKAVLEGGGVAEVSWKEDKYDHLVLVNGQQQGSAVKAGKSTTRVQLQPGKACVSVLATDGKDESSNQVDAAGGCLNVPANGAVNGNPSDANNPGTGPATSGTTSPTGGTQATQTQGTNTTGEAGLTVRAGQPLPPVVVRIDATNGCLVRDGPFCSSVQTERDRLIAEGHPAVVLQVVNPGVDQYFVFATQGFADIDSANNFCIEAKLSPCLPQSSAQVIFPAAQ